MQLFTPIVSEDKLHPNFRNFVRPENVFALDVLNDWAAGFTDRDNKFVQEFQTTFNSSFWELYVFAVLKKYGLKVDFSKEAPDFCLDDAGFNIECVVAEHAAGAIPEHERLTAEIPTDLNEFNRRCIIRLSNALHAKAKKYRERYSQLDHVKGRPFVIAAANFSEPHITMAAQRPIDAVLHAYYVDEEKWLALPEPRPPLKGEPLPRVLKDNGAPVELGIFQTPEFREISAVVFSGVAYMGKVRALAQDPLTTSVFTALRKNLSGSRPHVIEAKAGQYQESLLDGLRVYHNPYADHPLDPATFRHPAVFQSYFANDDWQYEDRDGLLQCRFVSSSQEKSPIG